MDTLNGNLPLLPDNIREASNGNYWVRGLCVPVCAGRGSVGTDGVSALCCLRLQLGGSSKRMAPFSLTDALGPYPIVRRLLTGLLPHDTIYKLVRQQCLLLTTATLPPPHSPSCRRSPRTASSLKSIPAQAMLCSCCR